MKISILLALLFSTLANAQEAQFRNMLVPILTCSTDTKTDLNRKNEITFLGDYEALLSSQKGKGLLVFTRNKNESGVVSNIKSALTGSFKLDLESEILTFTSDPVLYNDKIQTVETLTAKVSLVSDDTSVKASLTSLNVAPEAASEARTQALLCESF